MSGIVDFFSTALFDSADQKVQWITALVLIFAALFWGVGLFRIVEFRGIGVSRLKFSLLAASHVLGCCLFSSALVVIAIDVSQKQRVLMNALFFSGLAFLFPGQIYIALRRRRKMAPQQKAIVP